MNRHVSELTTIHEVLGQRAQQTPEQTAFSFLMPDAVPDIEALSYAQLDQRVTVLASRLVRPDRLQERAMLFFPPGLDYIVSFFGCLRAGLIAVPAYPPRASKNNARNLQRILTVIDDAKPLLALTTPELFSQVQGLFGEFPQLASLEWVVVTAGDQATGSTPVFPSLTRDHLAFLQYTSGSTSAPKGVMVSHGNLMANEAMIQAAFATDETTTCVGWLPLYHDMGLIGNILQPVYAGFTCHLMAPTTFLRQPSLWLETISRRRAVISGGPNFAYELCVQKMTDAQMAELDLSTWRVAFNGSEPIRAATLAAFSARFAACGFDAASHFPCYGLAETTLMVSGRARSGVVVSDFDDAALANHLVTAADPGHAGKARRLVGSGALHPDEQVLIVSPETLEPVEGAIGEIWVAGPHVAQGYWCRPDATEALFGAKTASGAGPFLRTGDLGFLHEGELFITGRLKELMILRGRNLYPQDVEQTVQASHEGLSKDGGAAFSIETDGDSQLVVVQEVERTAMRHLDPAVVIQKIRAAVAEVHEVNLYAVVLIKPASLPKTTSGKIRRGECQRMFLNGELSVFGSHTLASQAPQDAWVDVPSRETFLGTGAEGRRSLALRYLTGILAQTLEVSASEIRPGSAITSLGLDSLAAIDLINRLSHDFQVDYSLETLLDGPTVTEMADWLAEAILEALPATSAASITLREGALSYNQRALWFLHRLMPESAAYHIPLALRLLNPVSVPQLEAALSAVVARHPALRTVFLDVDGEPVQKAGDRGPHLKVVDATDWSDAFLAEERDRQAHLPIDVQVAAWNITLYDRGSKGPSELLLVAHHLVTDLWSMVIFFRELGQAYADPASLAELPQATYGDFVQRQAERLAGPMGERLLGYWQKQFATQPTVLALPVDRPRPPVQSHVGAACDFVLPNSSELRELAAKHHVTPFVVLLATWQVLLHRYSGQTDLCIGSPVAGRLAPEFGGVIGDFVNPVVFRGDLTGRPRFETLLVRVGATVRAGLDHQELPFEMLVERVCPSRDASYSPIFQAMFSLQKPHRLTDASAFVLADRDVSLSLGGLTVAPVSVPQRSSQVDVALVVVDDERLAARLVYNTDLFDGSTAARMANHFETLISAFLAQPSAQIDAVSLMSEAELRHVLTVWNDTAVPYERDQCLHQLLSAKAQQMGDKVALRFGKADGPDAQLTYAELDARAEGLAKHLRHYGVGPDVLVGVCLSRHPNLVVTLLAVMKAGGAYVPLDPTHPIARTQMIMEDAGLQVMVCEASQKERLGNGASLLVIEELLAQEAAPTKLVAAPDSRSLAYVIFTSGSTGRPKGVQLAHQSVVNFLQSMAKKPGFDSSDVMLAVTTVSFDIAGLELYLPLLVGGTLVLASSDEVTDGAALVENLRRNEVTVMQATPSTWRLVLDAAWQGPLTALCGGEALPGKLAQDLLAAGVRLWNMYGPTETTIWSAVGQVESAVGETRSEAVGLPIDNTTLYVLDRHGRPVPQGVAGELAIGGEGLARGYFRRPGLTATVFVPDPFVGRGMRLYRTGDLVRSLADGRLDFLGRIDFQVKLRGFRIEIGEIEASLGKHPGIREAVVVLAGKTEETRALVCYLTLPADSELQALSREPVALASSLRSFMRQDLPEYMIPSVYVVLENMPLTANNKVDRKALPEPQQLRPARGPVAPLSGLEATIAEVWSEFLNGVAVGPNDNFFDLGGHSLLLSKVNNRLKERLNLSLNMVDMFQYPTVSALAQFIRKQGSAPALPLQARKAMVPGGPIALIGMACRFPGAADVDAFWDNLKEARSGIITYTDQELREAKVSDELLANPHYVRAGGFLADSELFDARFFDLTPLDASLIDPQQRIFLEVCWHALESAHVNPDRYTGAIGVFAGAGMNTYLNNNLLTNPELVATEGDYRLMTTNDKDFLATRVAYKLNLRGPALTIQTACSTSLVAVHEACQSLRAGECDMALAGGSTIRVPGNVGYLYRDGLVFSPDGVCRAFDKQAGGTVAGNGAGVVLLKGLDQAMEDGDTVIAVIKGSAINNDAAQKVGFTAPGVEGQRNVILAAQAAAGVNPETITYIEAHGTATKMGDPIEISALTAAFRTQTAKTGFCAVGSVKTNIGHLDTAAGVAGLIKVALALKHGILPASLNYREPNPEIDFAASPFYVNDQTRPWTTEPGKPRRAAISSFGIGGTNVHAILEEAPAPAPVATQGAAAHGPVLLMMSARSGPALDALSEKYSALLEALPEEGLAGLALRMAQRKVFEHRRFLLAETPKEAAELLKSQDPKRLFSRREELVDRPVAFLFPGQGAQYPFMTAQLYAHEPEFTRALDDCCQRLIPHLGLDLRTLLYPTQADEAVAAQRLRQTQITQPALFVVEYALAQLLLSWGMQPRALMGHSVGEYVAATLAGVFSLDDALALIAQRGKLIATLPEGSMISVPMAEADLKPLLSQGLSIAAVNAPGLCVVSGQKDLIDAFAERMSLRSISVVGLRTSHAFHSSMMDPILAQFEAFVRSKTLHPPRLAVVSNLTGVWLTDEQATDPRYWVSHLREAVRFADGLTTLFGDSQLLLLEVGPGRTLTGLARRHGERGQTRVMLNLLPPADQRETEFQFFKESLGKLWLSGGSMDWSKLFPGCTPSTVPLPLYPYQRQRFWVEPGKGSGPAVGSAPKTKQANLRDWFYTPSWKRADRPVNQTAEVASSCWLVFQDSHGFGSHFVDYLRKKGHQAIRVSPGSQFLRVGEDTYTLQPNHTEDYQELLGVLKGSGRDPQQIVYCEALAGLSEIHEAPFYHLMNLSRALANLDTTPRTLTVVTDGAQDPFGTGIKHPHQALLSGLVRVLPQEHAPITCRSVDLDPNLTPDQRVVQLYTELTQSDETVVALRSRSRWVPVVDALPLEALPGSNHPQLREGGTYLITGGLGGIGLAVAEFLGRSFRANVVLMGRKAAPAPDQWAEQQSRNPLLRRLLAIEAAGARVMTVAADVSDESSLRAAVSQARERFGKIHGVIHAAGLPGGGAIAHRTVEDIQKVFLPKLQGTLALEKALAQDPPEFMALFSSVNALLGGFGQADYAAVNAFQDAFALARPSSPTHVVSINWDSWKDVGMAAAALQQAAGTVASSPELEAPGRPVAHPIFDRKLADEGVTATYISSFTVEKDWPLNEHWILDRAILPGTTYLEMARAALEDHTGQEAVTFRDVSFLAPLVVALGETRVARTVLTRKDGFFSFQVASRQDNGTWREHAMGQLYPLLEEPRQLDLEQLLAEHNLEEMGNPLESKTLSGFQLHKASRALGPESQVALTVITDGKEPPEVSIELGARWHAVSQVKLGAHSGIAKMELAPELRGDLAHYKLHPAILDFAVGFLRLFKNQASFLPLSYNRLSFFKPLEGEIYSHIALAPGYREDRGNPIFDISLIDAEGFERVRIEGFALGKIDRSKLDADDRAAQEKKAEMEAFTQFWLSPEEGVEAFNRALASGLNRVIVSTRDFSARLLESATSSPETAGALHGKGYDRPVHPRPDLMNPYVAPRNPQETQIAEIWQEVIGLEQVGIHDDFNDLGGDSLLITRIHARMKETFPNELSVAELMQYPNIADLSAYMNRNQAGAEAQKADRQVRMDRQVQAKKVQDKLKQARHRNPMSRSRK